MEESVVELLKVEPGHHDGIETTTPLVDEIIISSAQKEEVEGINAVDDGDISESIRKGPRDVVDRFCFICGLAVVEVEYNDSSRVGGSSGGIASAAAPIFQSLMELIGVHHGLHKKVWNRNDDDDDQRDHMQFCKECGDQVKMLVGLRRKLKRFERELKAGIEDINEKLAKSASGFHRGQTDNSVNNKRKRPEVNRGRTAFGSKKVKRRASPTTELEEDHQIGSKPVPPPPGPLRRSTRGTKGMRSKRFYNRGSSTADDDDHKDVPIVIATSSLAKKVSHDDQTGVDEGISLSDSSHLVQAGTNVKIEGNVDDVVDIEDDLYVPDQDPLDMDDDDANDDGDSDYYPEPEVDADANLSGPFNDSDSSSGAGGMASEDELSTWTPPPPPPAQSSPSKKAAPLLAPPSSKSTKRGRPPKNQKRQETTSASVTSSKILKSSTKLILPSQKAAGDTSTQQKIRVHPVSGVHTYLNTSFEKIGDSQYKCLTCEEVVTSLSRIKKHTNRSHTDNYVCNQCGMHKACQGDLNKHVAEVHEGRPRKPIKACHKCPICEKPFTHKITMEYHRVTHLSQEDIAEAEARGEKIVRYKDVYGRHQCTTCGDTFCNVTVLKKHAIKMHSKTEEEKAEVVRMCPHCGKSLCEQYFSRHIERYHSGLEPDSLKPFQCSECDKRFYTADRLLSHKRVHSGERPFQCDLCAKTFSNSRSLKHHVMRTHSNERPHGCTLCPAAFVTRDHLTRHIAGVHERKSQTEFYKERGNNKK